MESQHTYRESVHPWHGKSILLVEDNAIIGLAEAALLRRHEFDVVAVHTGCEAIEALRHERVDLVLMDIDLGPGEMDGTEVAQIILEERDLPVVFLTSHTEPEILEQVESITSYGYVTKNSGEMVLLASVRMAFKLHEAHLRANRRADTFRTLFENAADTMFLLRGEEMVDANAASEDLFGLSREELIGMTPAELSPPTQRDGRDSSIHARERIEAAATEGPQFFSWTHIHSDGRFVECEVSLNHTDLPEGRRTQATVRDVTRRERALESLRDLRTYYENLLAHIPVFVLGWDYTYLEVNDLAADLVDRCADELLGNRLTELFPGIEETVFFAAYRRVMESRDPETVTNEFVHPSGKRRWYRVEILPCATGIQCIAHDMTEIVETKEELRENEERFRLAVEGTRDGLWDWNLLTDEAYHSDQFERMLGYEPGELPNTSAAWSDLLHPDDQARVFESVEAYLQGETESYESTFRMRTKDGSWRWITGRGKALFDETVRATRFIGFNTDVTEQRVAEAELSAAVKQREHLLHELTHRVKNYLNLVSSLISLQKASSTDPTSIENIQRQIDAIRFVHDKLNRRDSVDRIEIRTYIQELLDTMFANFAHSSVEIENDIAVPPLPGEIALPLGLITNELATNTMKYGIPEAGGARFSISMSRSDSNGEYLVAVENNGPPIPESVDFDNPRTLGLQLVQALSNQIHATMSVNRAPHPRFELRFRLPD